MTANDNTPRQPDEDEPIEELLGDVLDLVDETVARITDAEVDEHLRTALSQTDNTDQANNLWLRCLDELDISNLNRQIGAPAKSPGRDAIANLMATLRGNTKLSWDLVLLSQRMQEEALDAARKQAEQIVAAARDEGLNEAAKMVREAREQADQIIGEARKQADQVVSEARSTAYHIISEAHGEADQIKTITAARSSQPGQTQVRDFGVCIPIACDAQPAQTPGERERVREWEDRIRFLIRLLCVRHNTEFRPGDAASSRAGKLSHPATYHIIAGIEQQNPLATGSIEAIPAKLGLSKFPLAGKLSLPKTLLDAMQTPAFPTPAFPTPGTPTPGTPINTIDVSAVSELSELIRENIARILAIGYEGTVVTGTLMTSPNHELGPLWEWRKIVLPDKCAENEPTLELEP
jgi:hypothetical protein